MPGVTCNLSHQRSIPYPQVARRLRGRCGMTQRSMADALGTSEARISRFENGRGDISATELINFVRVLLSDSPSDSSE